MGVPLAALAVRPPEQQPDAVTQIARAAALRNELQNAPLQQQALRQQVQAGAQENQMRAQQISDQQAVTKAMQSWDGHDPDELPGLVLKHGGSAQAVFGLKNQIIDQKTKLATLDKDQLSNLQGRSDIIAGHLEGLKGVPAEGKQQAYTNAVNDLVQKGFVQPNQLPAQYPGDDKIDLFEKQFMGQKALFDQEQKKRETAAAEQTAQARVTTAQTGAQKLAAEMPGGPLNRVSQEVAIQTNPQIQAGKVQVAAAEAGARAQAEAAVARQGNEALSNVPKQLVAPATAAAEKANKEYADAKSVSDRMAATMDAARKGNVVSYQIIPEEGTLQITTSQGVHRINKTEIDQYAGGGSLWQRMQGHFGHQLSGKSIPDSVLNDMKEIQDIQAKGAQSRYSNTLKSINQTYGSGFKPVEMGGLSDSGAHPFFSQFGGQVRPQ